MSHAVVAGALTGLAVALALGSRPRAARRGAVRSRRLLAERVAAALAPASGRVRAHDAPEEVAAVATALAAQLRAGTTTSAAWTAVAGGGPTWAGHVAVRTALGEPVAAALAGAGAPASLATACAASEATGAPLADVLERLADGQRHEAQLAAGRRVAAAAPRATVRVLAGLPLLALALGQALGADPVLVLLGDPVGRACGLLGALLAVAGLVVARRQVAAAERA